jgi:hypothetical protein
LVVTPSPLAFSGTVVGLSTSLVFTLYNSGSTPITGISTTASGDYTVTNPCQQTALGIGQSCTVQILFAPTSTGARPGVLTITSSDPASPITLPLTGTGIPTGSFTLSVNGGSSSSVTVSSGSPATYQLALTPSGGFTGTIALTCTPIQPAQFANCSLLPSSIALTASMQTSVATITTISSFGGNAALEMPSHTANTTFFCLLLPGLITLWRGRHQLRQRRKLLLALLFSAIALFAVGCANGGNFNTVFTPAGTYQYQVTASSTSGAPFSQTVTLNLTVTGR